MDVPTISIFESGNNPELSNTNFKKNNNILNPEDELTLPHHTFFFFICFFPNKNPNHFHHHLSL